MALTKLECDNAKAQEKPYKIFDGKGLYLEVQPNGSKYWRYKYRFVGKEKRLAIGVYPEGSHMKKIALIFVLTLTFITTFASASFAGNCTHSYDTAADGSRCGGRAADQRPGGD